MLNLEAIQRDVHGRLNEIRSIDRILQTEEFRYLFESASLERRYDIAEMIRNGNREGIETWVRQERQNDYSTFTLRELRIVAQRLGVRFYNHLPKASLLSEITNASRRPTEATSQAS